jgi:hypothetical protein
MSNFVVCARPSCDVTSPTVSCGGAEFCDMANGPDTYKPLSDVLPIRHIHMFGTMLRYTISESLATHSYGVSFISCTNIHEYIHIYMRVC